MKKLISLIAISLVTTQVFAAHEFVVENVMVGKSAIPFLKNKNVKEVYYNQLADYAQVEQMAPLTPAQLANVTAEDVRGLTMEQFNQLYARLSAGPMPVGDYSGYVLQKPPVFNAVKKRILKQAKLFTGFNSTVAKVCGRQAEDCLFEFIWKGKRFLPKNKITDQIETRTTVNVGSAALSKFTPDIIKRNTPDIIGNLIVDAADKFSFEGLPMEVYCGISQVDTRRESIVTDGGFGDDFPSYVNLRDQIVTRKGLNITEEYRMVRPGLYIGKAYSNKLFLFNVALEVSGAQAAQAAQTEDKCFNGKTTR